MFTRILNSKADETSQRVLRTYGGVEVQIELSMSYRLQRLVHGYDVNSQSCMGVNDPKINNESGDRGSREAEVTSATAQ